MPANVSEGPETVENPLREASKIRSMVTGRQARRSGMVAMLPKTQSRRRNTRSSRGHYRQWERFLRRAS
jgi:hypothetical protein